MNDATFDNLTRLLGARPSRRQVLKGIVGGGTLAVAGMTRAVEHVAAQCLEDGEACTTGTECCGGACSASLGVCVTMDDTCVADGDPCTDGAECCGGACSASIGVCVTMDECVADGDPCTDGSECCGGACSASMGVCVTMDGQCLADGQACSAGSDCCSGNCDASTGYCFTPTTTLPGTGSGSNRGTSASLLVPAAALGAAAVIGARRMRTPAHDEASD
ncbi:MAG TPA: hypothetical protein VFP05_02225 [Thermomicrobiales bacterium]|nr:hypothetical protein [Thermomicrobiales bacterium]